MQQLLTVPEIELTDYGPFVGTHRRRLPDSGLTLLKGEVEESGDGSGAGKSLFTSALAYLFGGCPFPATELQCWYADGPPTVQAPLVTAEGTYIIRRSNGLMVAPPGEGRKKALRGKAAEAELDRIFGMDAKMRAAVTYRGQDDTTGSLLAMSDPDKKAFLARLLQLDRFERVAAEAAAQAKDLRDRLDAMEARVEEAQAVFDAALRAEAAALPGKGPETHEADALRHESTAKDLRARARALEAEVEATRAAIAAELEQRIQQLDLELTGLARRPESAELRAARAALADYQGSDDLRSAKEKLATIAKRLERVRTYDTEKRQEHAGRRVGLQAQLDRERAALREMERLQRELDGLRSQEAKLETATCPTCEQTWCNDAALTKLAEIKGQVDLGVLNLMAHGTIAAAVARLEEELAQFPEFVPHPAGDELRAAQVDWSARLEAAATADTEARAVLRAHIETLAALRAQESDTVSARIDLQKREARAAAKARLERQTQGILVDAAVAKTDADRHDEAARAAHRLAGAARTAAAVHAERLKAVDTASERLDQLKAEHAELEKKVHFELDLHAMVGREGFLGVIFEDVLAEIAAATNDILGRVANVRAVTFQFETERESKSGSIATAITPIINLRGRRLPLLGPGLSGGMKSSVRLAVDLGVGEVVAKRRGSYPGWLILDETFNGLGPASKESCMEVLEAYAGSRLILVVDHDDRFQGLFNQKITIKQVDGRSQIC